MTSHREFYRRRLNARMEYASHAYIPMTKTACESQSHWRSFALSSRDGIRSDRSGKAKYLTLKELNGPNSGAPYIWFVEGMARTVTNDLPKLKTLAGDIIEDMELEPTFYQIDWRNQYRADCVGCPVRVHKLPSNEEGHVDNPQVDLTGIENDIDLVPYNVVDLPYDSMVAINDGVEFTVNPNFPYFSHYNKPQDEFWLNNTVDSTQCSNHPSVATAAHNILSKLNTSLNVGVDTTDHVATAFPPLFGKIYNPETTQTETVLFDPMLTVRENTMENPLADGGGQVRLDSDNATQCANVPRNFMNEKHCKLSRLPSTCSAVVTEEGLGISGDGVVICGSDGEIANDFTLGHTNSYDFRFEDYNNNPSPDIDWNIHSEHTYRSYKHSIWAQLALYGSDQLRQRVAWALYQVIPIGFPEDLDAHAETWLVYYDIFVRNAFGNYRDVLKQISYNEIMAVWLSFYNNQSVQSSINRKHGKNAPDENYAREVMQLFSVGLYRLNDDGSQQLDEDGNPIQTYDNDDIMSFARTWTGFVRSYTCTSCSVRGNAESWSRYGPHVDPLLIRRECKNS